MRIAIAGGTGMVGRYVVETAEARGHKTVVLSRSTGVDVVTGEHLASRLDGVDAVIDVLSIRTQRRGAAEDFFRTTSERLTTAGAAAGVGHHVTLSIIGADRVPTGYYHGKVVQETAVTTGPVPWTILRAAQFHEFAEQVLSFARFGPLSVVPQMVCQPVAAREVAAALVRLAEGRAVGWAAELAGPEPHQLVDLARQVNKAHRLGRRILPVRLPGAGGRAMRDGALLPSEPGQRSRQTFAAWVAR